MESTKTAGNLSNSKDLEEKFNSDEAIFIATFAHELRTPASAITYSVNLLLSLEYVDELVHGIYKRLLRQSNHLNFLIDTVMDCSCSDCGELILRKERVNITGLISQAIEITQPLFDAQMHQVKVAGIDEGFCVEADPTRLLQVFTNLLQNAAKYTPEAGKIDISVYRNNSNVVVQIKDDGIGIDGDLLPDIFNLFTRAEEARFMSQGAGIGLPLVRRLVDAHNGTIEARSNGKGQGSEFVVKLPC